MKSTVDCVPCYIRQVISTLRVAGVAEEKQYDIIYALFPTIAALDPLKTPAENTSLVLFEVYRLLGMEDPYKEAKAASNDLARRYFPVLERIIAANKDPLLTALKASVAGNAIDMGINPDFDVGASISRELERDFQRSDVDALRELLARGSPSLVVIGDNSGEIVFDSLLVATLRRYATDLSFVVKGGPTLNDATVEDALDVGMDFLAKVLTTGNSYLGVIPELCSPALRAAIASASVVIAKGQANYETLAGTSLAGDKTFFLLQAKCPVIAAHLKVDLGDSVLVRNQPQPDA
ncbi:MAG: DUF89 family protein [Firmicutes bacterium]|nr:DUF89 family protein [Bacillota bacterium]